jgi:hypothetical protein
MDPSQSIHDCYFLTNVILKTLLQLNTCLSHFTISDACEHGYLKNIVTVNKKRIVKKKIRKEIQILV